MSAYKVSLEKLEGGCGVLLSIAWFCLSIQFMSQKGFCPLLWNQCFADVYIDAGADNDDWEGHYHYVDPAMLCQHTGRHSLIQYHPIFSPNLFLPAFAHTANSFSQPFLPALA